MKNAAITSKNSLISLLDFFVEQFSPREGLDRALVLAVFALTGIGVVQVFSSSYIFATESFGDGLHFFRKQLIYAVLSFSVMMITAGIPWKWIEKFGHYIWHFAILCVVFTFVPHVGHSAGGAGRWILLPFGFRFEPSEILQIGVIIFLARMMAQRPQFFERGGWVKPLAIVGLPLLLLLKQPDFGSFAICTIVILSLLFFYGLRWRYILGAVGIMAPSFYFLVMRVPYRHARIMAFLDPWKDPGKGGFQLIQSMLSFHSGGLTGVGLGQSQGKLFFLPEAHTDFTLAILAEETGFVGVLVVLMLMGFLIFRGLQIGLRTQNVQARLMALGLTVAFGLKVLINTGVVMGLLPTKGLALPFLSYGGSSLLTMGVMFGLLLNIERLSRSTESAGLGSGPYV